MCVLAIDPGTTESAFITWDGVSTGPKGFVSNADLLALIRMPSPTPVAVEMIACYGMPVGREVFETCLLIGRIQEICHGQNRDCALIYRRDVKMYLCNSARAKDGNVRQALIDKFGAPGTKKVPGRLYGVATHIWPALAVADYYLSQRIKES